MMIPEMLNNKWHIAICIAFCIPSESWEKAARIPVAVVPMLDPSVSGYILSTVRTPIPTRGVIEDVKMELDCTSTVKIAPIKMAK